MTIKDENVNIAFVKIENTESFEEKMLYYGKTYSILEK